MKKEFDKPFAGMEKESLICARCGCCRSVCPSYRAVGWESASPRGRIAKAREIFALGNKSELNPEYVRRLTQCTLCGACAVECAAAIDTRKIWLALRKRIADLEKEPKAYRAMRDNLREKKNISNFPNSDRLEWAQDLDDPAVLSPRTGAEVGYFVGCVSSFFPQASQVPLAVAEIFVKAGVDFTTLGGEEWCCGFPLLSTGYADMAKDFMRHNVCEVRKLKIRTLVTSCPSCYSVWKHDSAGELQGSDLEIMHITEYLARLIREGRLSLQEITETVTYHDPCDLGRTSGIYEAPREVIKSIPGIRFVELPHHHERSLCCGGGGTLQGVDAELAAKIAKMRAEEIRSSGASIVVSACQQCEQMLTAAVREAKIPVRVMDVSQLILEAIG